MISVVVPVHNEEVLLGKCLSALRLAGGFPLLQQPVDIVVVLDSCSDASKAIALSFGVSIVEVQALNVGISRASGAAYAIAKGAQWLASTDADTVVAPDWLWQQLRQKADVVCGTISVDDWSEHGVAASRLCEHFARTYTDADGHSHIHGANFGVSTQAYQRAGGFPALSCSEDVAFVQTLIALGEHVVWTAAPRVVTSARRHAKARGGFGDTLLAVTANFS